MVYLPIAASLLPLYFMYLPRFGVFWEDEIGSTHSFAPTIIYLGMVSLRGQFGLDEVESGL